MNRLTVIFENAVVFKHLVNLFPTSGSIVWHLLQPLSTNELSAQQNTDTTFTRVEHGLWARCKINERLLLEVKLPGGSSNIYRIAEKPSDVEHAEIRFGLSAAVLHDLVSVALKKHTVLFWTQIEDNPNEISFRFADDMQFSECKIQAKIPDGYEAIPDAPVEEEDAPSCSIASVDFAKACGKLKREEGFVRFTFTNESFEMRMENKNDQLLFVPINSSSERRNVRLHASDLVEIANAHHKMIGTVSIYTYSDYVRFLFEGNAILVSYNLRAL